LWQLKNKQLNNIFALYPGFANLGSLWGAPKSAKKQAKNDTEFNALRAIIFRPCWCCHVTTPARAKSD